MAISQLVAFPNSAQAILVVADFTIHHPLPDPLLSNLFEKLAISFPYHSRSSKLGYGLLNQLGVYTLFSLGGQGRPFVFVLTFAFPALFSFLQSWDSPLASNGSDYVEVQIVLAHPISSPSSPTPN